MDKNKKIFIFNCITFIFLLVNFLFLNYHLQAINYEYQFQNYQDTNGLDIDNILNSSTGELEEYEKLNLNPIFLTLMSINLILLLNTLYYILKDNNFRNLF